MNRKLRPALAVALLALAMAGGAARAAEVYVSPQGEDGAAGTLERPLRTVQAGLEAAGPGDSVLLMDGVYHEAVRVTNSGEPGRPVLLRAVPGHEPVVDGTDVPRSWGLVQIYGRSHVVISGIRVQNSRGSGIIVHESDDIEISGSTTYNTAHTGIMIWESKQVQVAENEVERACQRGGEESVTVKFGSEAVEVRDNHIHHTGHEGIDVKEGCHGVRVHGNHIHHVERQGLYADAWNRDTGHIEFFNNVIHDCGFGMVAGAETGGLLHDTSYYNNVVYNCEGPGIAIADWGRRDSAHPMRNIRFLNNTIYNCGFRWGGGILFENAEAEEVIVRNNILSHCGPPLLLFNKSTPSLSMDHNLFDGETGEGGRAVVFGDPLFADPEAGDYHLRAGSPAVDSGSADGAPDFDIDRETRPQGEGVDIGADEMPPAKAERQHR